MPAIKAHYAFGKEVLHRLHGRAKDVIENHMDMYVLGLQGPDLLFFAKPITGIQLHKIGSKIHHEAGYRFFGKAAEQYENSHNEGFLAYSLGCMCHFWLDKSCHPYVYEVAPKMGQHNRLESDLDHLVMDKTNLTVEGNRLVPQNHIQTTDLAQLYDISTKDAALAVKDFRRFSALLEHTVLVKTLENLTGFRGKFSGMCPYKEMEYAQECDYLWAVFLDSISPCCDAVQDFYRKVVGLSYEEPNLSQNFEGEQL